MKKIIIAGIMILVSISTLFRGLYFTYETYGFMAILALLSILYFLVKIRNNETVHIHKLIVFAGLALTAANIISFTRAANPRENIGTLLLYSGLLIFFIVLYDYFYGRKQKLIRYMMMLVPVSGSASAVVGTMALTGRFDVWEVTTLGQRVGATFQYANTAAVYFVICLIFVITIANTERNTLLRGLAAGMGSIFLYAFFLTGSRGGYLVCMLIIPLLLILLPAEKWINSTLCLVSMTVPVFLTMKGFNSAVAQHSNLGAALNLASCFAAAALSYFLAIVLYGLIMRGRELTLPKWVKCLFVGVLILSLTGLTIFRESVIQLLPAVMSNRLNRLMAEGFNDINILIRLQYDKDALKLIADSWLTGLGGGGWKAMYQSVQDYSYTAAFVHNHYLQVFVENGVLGFLSFTAMVVISVGGCIHSYVKSQNAILRSYTAGVLCAVVSLAGHAAGDFDLSFVSMLMLLWTLFAASMVFEAEGLVNSAYGKTEEGNGTSAAAMVDGTARTHAETFGNDGGIPITRFSGRVGSKVFILIITAVCSVLFSFYGMYFAGAYNENIGFKYDQKKDYVTALAYYEEAARFDPANSFYSFELAKLYHYFGKNSMDSGISRRWLEKARQASEKSIRGNDKYPAYMKTLVLIYLDCGLPMEALETSQKLAEYKKYDSEVYELLAKSYIESAKYCRDMGNNEKARELLTSCIKIDWDQNLRRTVITKPNDIGSREIISGYKHSDDLAGYLYEAESLLKSTGQFS